MRTARRVFWASVRPSRLRIGDDALSTTRPRSSSRKRSEEVPETDARREPRDAVEAARPVLDGRQAEAQRPQVAQRLCGRDRGRARSPPARSQQEDGAKGYRRRVATTIRVERVVDTVVALRDGPCPGQDEPVGDILSDAQHRRSGHDAGLRREANARDVLGQRRGTRQHRSRRRAWSCQSSPGRRGAPPRRRRRQRQRAAAGRPARRKQSIAGCPRGAPHAGQRCRWPGGRSTLGRLRVHSERPVPVHPESVARAVGVQARPDPPAGNRRPFGHEDAASHSPASARRRRAARLRRHAGTRTSRSETG